MPSRPQFSLRMLLFVAAMVCLSAATLNEPPEVEQALRNAQALLRASLCVAFSAALVAGAMRADGYLKTFYIGGTAAATLPLLVLIETASGSLIDLLPSHRDPWLLPGYLMRGIVETSPYRWWFAKLWASVPGFALAAVGFDWMFRLNACSKDVRVKLTARRFFVRGALFMMGATCLAAIAAMPAPDDRTLAILQSWLAGVLCVFFAAMLAVGAVQGPGYFKTFCIGGLLPALLAVVWLYVATIFLGLSSDDTSSVSRWINAFVFENDVRFVLAAHWTLIPVLGTAFVVCRWLFQRGKCGARRE